jgi:hypothetical protein
MSMGDTELHRGEVPARAVALMVAANGRIDRRELHALDRLDAFRRLGVSRERLLEMANDCMQEIGTGWRTQPWLPPVQSRYVDAVLHPVRDPRTRLLVCRLATAVMVADGRVTNDECLIYTRSLARWQINQTMVARAIMNDSLH